MIYVKANKNWGVLAPHFLQSPSKPVGDKKRGNKNDFFVLLYSCQTGNGVPFCYDQIGVQCNCIEQLHFKQNKVCVWDVEGQLLGQGDTEG